MKLTGIDVSEHQGNINWNAVKNQGIDYAIIRVGYGDNYASQDDKYFKRNADMCTSLGIPFGVYIYSYATNLNQVNSEADHVLRLIKGYKLSYPVYFDMEDGPQGNLSQATLAAFGKTFCDKIAAAGYKVGVYANLNWWNNKLSDPVFNNYERWVAQYNVKCDYKGEYGMWQYTSSGSVSGISGRVDMNYCYKDYGGGGSEPTPEPAPPPPAPSYIMYKAHTRRQGWLPYANSKDTSDFAGRNNFDANVDGIMAYAQGGGDIYYKVHIIGGGWLPEVKNITDYAGLYGWNIDCVKMRVTGIYGNDVEYQVYTNGRWLPWVRGYRYSYWDDNSYAGIYGSPIRAIRVRII